jgi:hypothetical protein
MAGRHEGKDGQGGTWTLVLFNFHIPPCPSIPSSLPVIPFLHPSIHFLSFVPPYTSFPSSCKIRNACKIKAQQKI